MKIFKALASLILAVLLFVPFTVSPDNSFSTSIAYAGGSSEPPPMNTIPPSSGSSTDPASAEEATEGESTISDQADWSFFDQFLFQVTLLLTF